MTVLRELARYKLDLVGVQEVRWEVGGTEPAGDYTFFYGKGNENLAHKRNISAVKRVEFVSVRITYIKLRGCWCHHCSNIHAPTHDKNDDVKDNFYEELERV
jgi:hypothetical protein